MLSRFFGKSQPLHYIVLGVVLLLVFTLAKFLKIEEPFSFFLLIEQMGLFLLCVFTVFIFDFLTSKNKLTKKNSYDILMFVLFMALIPESITNSNVLISHFLVVLALRRIISLRSKKEIKKKLLDASLWIGLAALFYFWSITYFLLIFMALSFYSISDIKNFIVPYIGIICVLIISLAYLMVFGYDYYEFYRGLLSYSFDFSQLNSLRLIIGITLLLSYGNWALFFYIKQLKSKQKRYRPAFIIVVFAEIIALIIVAFTPQKDGSEFIFLFAPLAIIMTNYLENIQEKWFREVLIWVLVITPIVTLFL
ncbi:MAG: DUF6427 family protein [Flavobacteriaceae bacterium]|nr:DUF6427 family protein [Flavobacteriaceae bacterium]